VILSDIVEIPEIVVCVVIVAAYRAVITVDPLDGRPLRP